MKEANIGGVELQILYPLSPDDTEKCIHNLEFMSPEFLDTLKFTADCCERLGIAFDLTPGSSWPYGGGICQ